MGFFLPDDDSEGKSGVHCVRINMPVKTDWHPIQTDPHVIAKEENYNQALRNFDGDTPLDFNFTVQHTTSEDYTQTQRFESFTIGRPFLAIARNEFSMFLCKTRTNFDITILVFSTNSLANSRPWVGVKCSQKIDSEHSSLLYCLVIFNFSHPWSYTRFIPHCQVMPAPKEQVLVFGKNSWHWSSCDMRGAARSVFMWN